MIIHNEELDFLIEYFGFVAASLTIVQIIFINLIPRLEKRYSNKKAFLQIYTVIPGIGFILMSMITFLPVSIALILIVIGMGFSRRIIFTQGINKQIETENLSYNWISSYGKLRADFHNIRCNDNHIYNLFKNKE